MRSSKRLFLVSTPLDETKKTSANIVQRLLWHLKNLGFTIVKQRSSENQRLCLGDHESIKKEDVFLFHLPYASLRGNLAVSVVDVVALEGKSNIHLKFKDVDMLTHIKLNQYLHRKKVKIQAA